MCRTASSSAPGPVRAVLFAVPLLVAVACAGGPEPEGSAAARTAATDRPAVAATQPLAAAPDTFDEPPPIEAGQAPPPGPYAPGFDAVHYDIALLLPEAGDRIRGRTTARIALTEPRADTLPLDLTGLAVTGVRVDGRDVRFRYRAGTLRVPVPADRAVGDTIAVEVDYAGTPDDGLIIQANLHGERAVFADNWPNRARFWFPSIDHPSDKATVAFTVEAPEGWTVIANGRLVEAPEGAAARVVAHAGSAMEGGLAAAAATAASAPTRAGDTASGGRAAWRWATDIPIPTYTMVVGASRLAVGEVGPAACDRAPASPDDCIAVSYWVFPQDSATAARAFDRADDMVEIFTDLIAPFPYEKLANVQSSTRFGGMENSSAIFYSERAISGGGDIDGLVAHEIAHQWFGDAVTEADWHHLWLSEGFATYLSALFFERADGIERFREVMEAERLEVVGADVVDRPIVDPAEDDLFGLLNDNNYEKGAWVLHMLRGLLGDDTFFDGLRRYYRAHMHGTALTDDLQRALEAASGRELGWFFEQWVFRPGYPRLRTDWRWDADAGEAQVTIEQVQPDAWPVFRTPITLEFVVSDGAVRRTVEIDARAQTFRLALPSAPAELRIDPDGWVLAEVVG